MDVSVMSVATPIIAYRVVMIGSTGSSTRMREARLLGLVDTWSWLLFPGKGDREREVERELWPERDILIGMCMLRDSRRDSLFWDAHADVEPAFVFLRGLASEGDRADDDEFEGTMGTGALSFAGKVLWRRSEPGLDDREAA